MKIPRRSARSTLAGTGGGERDARRTVKLNERRNNRFRRIAGSISPPLFFRMGRDGMGSANVRLSRLTFRSPRFHLSARKNRGRRCKSTFFHPLFFTLIAFTSPRPPPRSFLRIFFTDRYRREEEEEDRSRGRDTFSLSVLFNVSFI